MSAAGATVPEPIPTSTSPSLAARLANVPVAAAVCAFLIVLVACSTAFVDGFGTYSNATTILAVASAIVIASLGQLLAVISGGFDLAIGGVVPLSAVVFAKLTTAGHSVVLAILAVLAIGIAVGLVHMLVICRWEINALIATLATLSITGGIAFTVADGQTIAVPIDAGVLGEEAFGQLPWHVLLAGALALGVALLLQRSVFGRRIYLIGGNLEAARLAGVRVVAVGGGVYMLSGIFAAMAGVVLASQVLAATGSLGSEVTLQTLTAVVLGGAALTGGRGGVGGAVVGVLLLGVVGNSLSILRVPSFYQQIITGLVLLLAVGLGKFQDNARRRV